MIDISSEDTIHRGYVTKERLASIMAKEKIYGPLLPEVLKWLKKELKCLRQRKSEYDLYRLAKAEKELQGLREVTSEKDRVRLWDAVISCFPPPVHHFTCNMDFIPSDSVTRSLNFDWSKAVSSISLEELKKYFTQLRIPLPTRLFPVRDHKKIDMGKAVKGQEIRIEDFQLLQIIKKEQEKKYEFDGYKPRLQPYSPVTLEPIFIHYFTEIRKPFDPYHDQEANLDDLLSHLSALLFNREEVEPTLEEYGLFKEERPRTGGISEGKKPQELIRTIAETEIGLKTVFPCKPGTKWEDITMTLIANNMLRIRTPQGEGRFTYNDLGMQDRRKGDKPKVIWPLLASFAIEGGVISRQNVKYDRKLVDNAKRLDRHLQDLFEIYDRIYQAHYKKEKAYRTKINFRNETIYKSAKGFLS